MYCKQLHTWYASRSIGMIKQYEAFKIKTDRKTIKSNINNVLFVRCKNILIIQKIKYISLVEMARGNFIRILPITFSSQVIFSLSILSDFYYQPSLFIYIWALLFLSPYFAPWYGFIVLFYTTSIHKTVYKPQALKGEWIILL